MYASAEDKAIYQDDARQFIIEALYDNLANLPLMLILCHLNGFFIKQHCNNNLKKVSTAALQ